MCFHHLDSVILRLFQGTPIVFIAKYGGVYLSLRPDKSTILWHSKTHPTTGNKNTKRISTNFIITMAFTPWIEVFIKILFRTRYSTFISAIRHVSHSHLGLNYTWMQNFLLKYNTYRKAHQLISMAQWISELEHFCSASIN